MLTQNFIANQDSGKRRLVRRAGSVCFWSLWILGVATSQQALAQQRGFAPVNQDVDVSSLIEAPREFQRLLDEVDSAIQRKEWGEATQGLGILLGLDSPTGNSDRSEQDFFMVEENDAKKLKQSLREEVRKRFRDLPDEGRNIVELRFGVTARQMLDKAAAEGDWSTIQKLVREYGFTVAGREAAWLLIEHRIEKGQLDSALLMLSDLLESANARQQFGSSIGVLAAACAKGIGQSERAQALMASTSVYWPNEKLEWNGKPIVMGADGLADLSSLDLKSTKTENRFLDEWRLMGGRADHNGESNVGAPSILLAWEVDLHDSLQSEEGVLELMRRKMNDNATVMPSRIPLICSPRAIVQTYDQRLFGINLKNGRLDWISPYSGLPVSLPRSRNAFRQFGAVEAPVQSYLTSRVWGEASTGLLSADRDRLYVVSDVSALEAAENLVLDSQVTRTARQESYNVLRSWSLISEGKLLWEVGGEGGLGDPRMAGVLFLGPPTPFENELLVLGELNGEVILFGLEPTTGRQLWKQQLIANNTTPISAEPKRRNLSCSPSVSGGVAVCPTLSGYLVAYDLGKRSLRWAAKYGDSRRINPRAAAFGYNQPDPFDPFSPRSIDNAVVIANGCAVHAPSDADTIYAVDVQTGEMLWSMTRGDWRYLGGVWRDSVLVVGERELMACNIRSGQPVWKEEKFSLPAGDRVAGMGVRNRSKFYLPLTSQQIIEFDIESGTIVARTRVEGALGNLVSDGNMVLSVSPFGVSAYRILARLKSEIGPDAQPDAKGLNVSQQIALAAMLLSENDIDGAMKQAKAAYRSSPDDFDAQMTLQKTCLEALKVNFDKYISDVSEFENLMAISPNRRLYFLGMVDGYVKKKDFVRAFAELLKFSEEKTAEQQRLISGANLIQWKENWSIDIDRWIDVTARRIFNQADEKQRKEMIDMARPRMEAASQLSSFPQEFVKVFGFLPGSEEMRMRYAQSLLESNKSVQSEQILLELAEQTNNVEIARKAAVALVSLYRISGRPTAAIQVAKKYGIENIPLQDELFMEDEELRIFGDDPFESPDFLSRARLPDNADVLMRGIDGWPKGEVTVDPLPPSQGGELYLAGTGVCPIIHCGGEALRDWVGQTATQGFLFSGPLGMEHIYCQIERGRGGNGSAVVRTLDSLILIELPGEIIAIDSFRNTSEKEILWRQSFDESGSFAMSSFRAVRGEKDRWGRILVKPNRGFTILGLTRQSLVVGMRDELVAFDPISGERLWMRNGISRNVAGALDGDKLVVIDGSQGKRMVLDVRDGSLLEETVWQGELNVLAVNGPRLLMDVGIQDSLRTGKVVLEDVHQGKTLLEREFPKRSVAEVSENRFFVVWQPDGKVVTWDLSLGKEYVYDGAPWKHPLDSLRLMQFGDRIVLLPFGSMYAVDPLLTILDNPQYIRVSGPVIAIQSSDGQPAWAEPVEALQVGVPISLSRRTPALVMVRRVKWRPEKSQSSVEVVAMSVADVRTGKIVYQSDNMGRSLSTSPFSFVANLDTDSIDVGAVGRQVRLTWTDQPAPPPPPAKVGCLTRNELEEWLKKQPERNEEEFEVPEDR